MGNIRGISYRNSDITQLFDKYDLIYIYSFFEFILGFRLSLPYRLLCSTQNIVISKKLGKMLKTDFAADYIQPKH